MALPSIKQAATLIFDSDTGGTQNPLTANFKASTILDCARERLCALQFLYDAHASSTTNRMQAIVMVSNPLDGAAAPAIGDDVWTAISRADESTADAVVTGTFPSGFDMTAGPAVDWHTMRPIAFDTQVMTSGTQKIRASVVVDVSPWRYLVVIAKELGDTTNVGVLKVRAAFSA